MDNCLNLEQLFNYFNNKIEIIYELIPLTQLYDNSIVKNEWNRNAILDSNQLNYNNSNNYSKQLINKRPDLREISKMIIEMKTTIEDIKCLLKQRKQQIISQNNKIENDSKLIERHFDHINQNIPAFLEKSNQNKSKTLKTDDKTSRSSKPQPIDGHKNGVLKVSAKTNQKTIQPNLNNKSTQELRIGTKSVQKKVVSKGLKNIPNISFITTEEFSSIPQYILGRISYDVINRAIADFNRTIANKYKIINNYSTKYSDELMRKYVNYKEQENSETDGQYFCTINDLKELSDLKADPTVRKILTCLRHCKRIREIRGNPPKLIRYTLLNSPELDI